MKYKIEISATGMQFENIYRKNIISALKCAHKIILSNMTCILERGLIEEVKIYISESKIIESKYFIKKQRTIFVDKEIIGWSDLKDRILKE